MGRAARANVSEPYEEFERRLDRIAKNHLFTRPRFEKFLLNIKPDERPTFRRELLKHLPFPLTEERVMLVPTSCPCGSPDVALWIQTDDTYTTRLERCEACQAERVVERTRHEPKKPAVVTRAMRRKVESKPKRSVWRSFKCR